MSSRKSFVEADNKNDQRVIYDKKRITGLKDLYLEIAFKSTNKPNVIINFFNVDADLIEDFELQRIEKWQKLITDAVSEQRLLKMAS